MEQPFRRLRRLLGWLAGCESSQGHDLGYQRADNGNVALTGEIDPAACNGQFVLAIGFGRNDTEAALRAHTSLQSGFDHLLDAYMAEWENWFASHQQTGSTAGKALLSKTSLAVLRVHEDQLTCGGIIASLSIPWGQSRGDDDLGGYHLVWIRDQVEAVGGMLAAGVREDVYRIFEYLRATQESDGRWPQNMWLDGRSFWVGIQMDEIGLPILLLDLSRREGAVSDAHLDNYYDMVRRAASYIVRNGPATPQDRWEEVAGYSPFTLAVEIAALLVAADFMDRHGDHADAAYLRDTADYWNSNIEAWCYVLGTPSRSAPAWTATTCASPRLESGRQPRHAGRCQRGCPRPRALRPARSHRPPHPQHRQGH